MLCKKLCKKTFFSLKNYCTTYSPYKNMIVKKFLEEHGKFTTFYKHLFTSMFL